MLVLQRNTFHLERDIHHAVFRREMVNLTHDIVEAIEERVPEIAGDLELSEDDVTDTELKNAMLWQFVAYVTQRPDMPHSEILDIRQVDHEAHAAAYFQQAPSRADSPVDESPYAHTVSDGIADYAQQVRELEAKVQRLEAENARLKAQNKALEQGAIASMRYKPSKREKPVFGSLDDYIGHMLRSAVRDELQVLGYGSL